MKEMQTAFPSLGWLCWGWVYNNKYQKWISNGWALRLLYLLDNDEMKHVPFSPNLYTTALTVLHVMFTVTFKREGHANWPARLQVEL
jgi:hypothetical protein